MKKIILAIAFLSLALAFLSPAKSFALMADIGTAGLAKEAKIIVQGEVKSVKSYKGINDVIYTRASVSVSDVVKGKIAKKNITVEYRGGEIGDLGLFVEDTPTLEKGEQTLLFLTNSFWRKNVYYVVGGVLGKYAICPDDTVRIGSSCDESDESDINAEENQTLDELLSEIENAE